MGNNNEGSQQKRAKTQNPKILDPKSIIKTAKSKTDSFLCGSLNFPSRPKKRRNK